MGEEDKRTKATKICLSPLNDRQPSPAGLQTSEEVILPNVCPYSILPMDVEGNILALRKTFKCINTQTCICSSEQNERTLFGHFEASAHLCSSVRQIEESIQERVELTLMKDCLLRLQASCDFVNELEKTLESYVAFLKDLRTRGPEKTRDFTFKGQRFHELCQTAKAQLTFWSMFRERYSSDPRLRLALLRIESDLRSVHIALARVVGGLTSWIASIILCVLHIANFYQWRISKQLHGDISGSIEDYNRLYEYSRTVSNENETIFNLEQVESSTDSVICERFGFCASTSRACTTNVCSISLNKLLNEIASKRAYTLGGHICDFLCQHEEIARTLKYDFASDFDWEDFNVAGCSNKVTSLTQQNGVITVLDKNHVPLVKLHPESPLLSFDSLEHEFISQLITQLSTSTTLMLSQGVDKKLFMHKSLPQQGLHRAEIKVTQEAAEGQTVTVHTEQEVGHGILKNPAGVISPKLSKRVQWHHSLDTESKAQLSVHYMDMVGTSCGMALYNMLELLNWKGTHQLSLLGPLPLWSDSVMMLVVTLLESLCMSGSLPSSGCLSLQIVSRHIHGLASTSRWDAGLCDFLGVSLKDKCSVHSKPEDGCPSIVSIQKLVMLFNPLRSVFESAQYWKHHPNQSDLNINGIFKKQTLCVLPLMSRVQALLSLSIYWLDSRLYHLLSLWSLPPFFMLLHWDLPLLLEVASRTVCAVKPLCVGQGGDCSWGSLPIQLEELQESLLMLEGISKKYATRFTEDLSKLCHEFYQEAMPVGRSWKKNRQSGTPCQPNSYIEHAVIQILEPVFSSTSLLQLESQLSLVGLATSTMMETWSEHILKEEIIFSFYGAQQLQLDFNYVKYWISSDSSCLQEEVQSHLLSLDVFHYLDGAVRLLMLQPRKKKQTMDELDVELESNISAVSSSSVLSSFSGVDIDGYEIDVLNDKTIPNKQRWLDLRLRGGKSKKGLLPFCLKVQEME